MVCFFAYFFPPLSISICLLHVFHLLSIINRHIKSFHWHARTIVIKSNYLFRTPCMCSNCMCLCLFVCTKISLARLAIENKAREPFVTSIMKILAITYRLEFKHEHEHEYNILCAVCNVYMCFIHNSCSGFFCCFIYLFISLHFEKQNCH